MLDIDENYQTLTIPINKRNISFDLNIITNLWFIYLIIP